MKLKIGREDAMKRRYRSQSEMKFRYVTHPGFDRRVEVDYNCHGFVSAQTYKGYLLLSVDKNDGGPAWLSGDDIDKVITMLRDAKRVWLKMHRETERELLKRGAIKPRKPRKHAQAKP